MYTPENKSQPVSYIEIFAWIISLALVGVILGGILVFLIKSQKPVVIIDQNKIDEDARYLNPIDRDPIKGLVFKVPDSNDTIKVYTGYEEDSPIQFSRKIGRSIHPLNKCICGDYHKHEDCNVTNCVEGCECKLGMNRTNTKYGR